MSGMNHQSADQIVDDLLTWVRHACAERDAALARAVAAEAEVARAYRLGAADCLGVAEAILSTAEQREARPAPRLDFLRGYRRGVVRTARQIRDGLLVYAGHPTPRTYAEGTARPMAEAETQAAAALAAAEQRGAKRERAAIAAEIAAMGAMGAGPDPPGLALTPRMSPATRAALRDVARRLGGAE